MSVTAVAQDNCLGFTFFTCLEGFINSDFDGMVGFRSADIAFSPRELDTGLECRQLWYCYGFQKTEFDQVAD